MRPVAVSGQTKREQVQPCQGATLLPLLTGTTATTRLSLRRVVGPMIKRVERTPLDAQLVAVGRQAGGAAVSAAGDDPSHPYIILIHAVQRPPFRTERNGWVLLLHSSCYV